MMYVVVFLCAVWSAHAQDAVVSDTKVVCTRDLVCKMLCPFGMMEDERGCPTCHCNPSPCEAMACPEGQRCELSCLSCSNAEAKCVNIEPDCPMLKCVPCESGRYFTDQHGCQTCGCILGPPEPVVDPIEPCPFPMCANECPVGYCETMFCENGFVKDERGCDMCICKEQPKCECPLPFMECNLVVEEDCTLEPCQLLPQCSVPSLCSVAKAMNPYMMTTINDLLGADLNLERTLDCDESGQINPRQCTADESYCWCVDDRGVYIPGTRREMIEGADEDMCTSRKTLMMQLAFQLVHDLQEEDVQDALEDIKRMVKDKVSTWLGMDQEVVLRIQVTVIAPGVLGVDVNVMSDGFTDLPSAALLMHHCMESEDWEGNEMALGDHTLRTKPGSLQTKHLYDLEEPTDLPVVDPFDEEEDHEMWQMVLYPALAAILFVSMLGLIVCAVQRRKRSASYQFAHKKMENMDNFKKNLILSSEWEKPELLCKDQVVLDVEKKPLA